MIKSHSVSQRRGQLPSRDRFTTFAHFAICAALILASATIARAADNATTTPPPAPATPAAGQPAAGGKAERMDVDAIRRKYWERGDDNDARVIQNRLYSKALKIEIGAYYGSISTDPFLSVRSVGGSVGFHLTESWGFDFLYWKDYVSNSSAVASLAQTTGDIANTNPPNNYKGGEVAYSPIYGKLSLFGSMIIHYDLHFLAGYGINSTQSGNDGTISLGIGQQFYLTKFASLRIDYRAMHFNEDVYKSGTTNVVLTRGNWTDVITLGVTAFIGPL